MMLFLSSAVEGEVGKRSCFGSSGLQQNSKRREQLDQNTCEAWECDKASPRTANLPLVLRYKGWSLLALVVSWWCYELTMWWKLEERSPWWFRFTDASLNDIHSRTNQLVHSCLTSLSGRPLRSAPRDQLGSSPSM